MKKYRWQILIFVIALIAVAILLLGQNEPVAESVGELEEQPVVGGLYTEALIGDIVRLNPLMDDNNQVDRDINRLIFSSLIEFDYRGNPQPELAVEWGISYDGLVYSLELRQDAFWHDGEQVTTEDVLFTIDQLAKPEYGLPEDVQALWNAAEVTAYDDFNLKLVIEEPFAPFLDYLAFGVLPQHLLGSLSPVEMMTAQYNLAPIGSGPYAFEQLTTADGMITGVKLSAFDDYFEGRPFIDEVEFKLYSNFGDAWAAYQAEEVIGLGQIPFELAESVSGIPELALFNTTLPEVVTVVLNHNNNEKSFMQNAEIRKALLMGINRGYLTSRIMQGEAVAVDSPILPGTWAYFDGIEKYDYDALAAEDILISEGYVIPAEGGSVRMNETESLSLSLLYEDTPVMRAVADRIQLYWNELGIEVELEAASLADMLTMNFAEGNFDAALVTYSFSDTPDPDPYPFWHESQVISGQNYSGWSDRRASEYLESARMSTIRTERERLYRNFQIHFSKEVPALLLYQPVYTFAVSTEVSGISVGPLYDPADRFNDIASWFLPALAGGEQVDPETESTE